jgi:hypothetical protein
MTSIWPYSTKRMEERSFIGIGRGGERPGIAEDVEGRPGEGMAASFPSGATDQHQAMPEGACPPEACG